MCLNVYPVYMYINVFPVFMYFPMHFVVLDSTYIVLGVVLPVAFLTLAFVLFMVIKKMITPSTPFPLSIVCNFNFTVM